MLCQICTENFIVTFNQSRSYGFLICLKIDWKNDELLGQVDTFNESEFVRITFLLKQHYLLACVRSFEKNIERISKTVCTHTFGGREESRSQRHKVNLQKMRPTLGVGENSGEGGWLTELGRLTFKL